MVTIREATSADVDTFYDLLIAIARHQNQEQFINTNKHELLKSGFSESPAFGVLLAEVDDKVVGYASYTWNYSIWFGSTYMNIDDVFVYEEHRGQKVGEALMLKAKEVCKGKGFSLIRWEVKKENHQAIKFYERLGAEVNIKGIFRWKVAD